MLNPIKFNNETIFTPDSWEESSTVIETVSTTEAGVDQVAVTRYDKLSISCSFNCSSVWAKKFKVYSKQDSIAVTFYDMETEAYGTRSMRIRNFKASLVNGSHRTSGTRGLWSVSFNLEEF